MSAASEVNDPPFDRDALRDEDRAGWDERIR
jgi:hypothetical protein